MNGTKRNQYWDTCVFFALLKKEEHKPGEYEALRKAAIAFDTGQLVLMTSAITLAELLAGKLSSQQADCFYRMSTRSNFLFIDANDAICRLASEIRKHFRDTHINGLHPSTPDAIHVASAIHSKASALITFDCNDKQNEMAMMNILADGKVCGKYPLVIQRPVMEKGEQNALPLETTIAIREKEELCDPE